MRRSRSLTTFPSVGSNFSERILRNVDFPVPLIPTRAILSPLLIPKYISLNSQLSLNEWPNCSVDRILTYNNINIVHCQLVALSDYKPHKGQYQAAKVHI